MKTSVLIAALLAGPCLWAEYQYAYTDGLTSINSSKWSQSGNLSAGPNGVTGNGALVSTVAVPTGNDYDVRMTIQTASQGACAGSYTLYARSTPDNSTAYALTATSGTIALYRVVSNSWTELSWLPYPCGPGTAMRLVVRGNNLTFWSGPNAATYQDATPIAAGQPGIGISATTGDTVQDVQIGPIDYLLPTPISSTSIKTGATPNRVDLRWPAASVDANSAGLQGYVIYRDGIYLGSPLKPTWLDQTVTSGETTTYSIYAADQHCNLSPPGTVTVTVPEGIAPAAKPTEEANIRKATAKTVLAGPSVDQREIGVRSTGTYWGAAGENIDLLSGNLNFSIPIIKALSRGDWSVTFGLSYNSQMWREDNPSNDVWLLGEDLGVT